MKTGYKDTKGRDILVGDVVRFEVDMDMEIIVRCGEVIQRENGTFGLAGSEHLFHSEINALQYALDGKIEVVESNGK